VIPPPRGKEKKGFEPLMGIEQRGSKEAGSLLVSRLPTEKNVRNTWGTPAIGAGRGKSAIGNRHHEKNASTLSRGSEKNYSPVRDWPVLRKKKCKNGVMRDAQEGSRRCLRAPGGPARVRKKKKNESCENAMSGKHTTRAREGKTSSFAGGSCATPEGESYDITATHKARRTLFGLRGFGKKRQRAASPEIKHVEKEEKKKNPYHLEEEGEGLRLGSWTSCSLFQRGKTTAQLPDERRGGPEDASRC